MTSLRSFIEKQKALNLDLPMVFDVIILTKEYKECLKALEKCTEALEKIAKGYEEGCFNFQSIADYDIKTASAALQFDLGESE